MNKLLSYLTPALLVVVLILQIVQFGGESATLGGTTNYDQLDTTDGYSVDSTSIIDASGLFTGTFIGTASSSIPVTLSGTSTIGAITTSGSSSLSGTSTVTLTATQICQSSVLLYEPEDAAASATMPSANTLFTDCLSDDGTSKQVLLLNTAEIASSTFVIAGASTTLVNATSTAERNKVPGFTGAILTFIRENSTSGTLLVNIFDY